MAVLAVWAASAPIGAATITWGTPSTISGDGDVSTAGTLFEALNFGPTTTVNGVIFQASTGYSGDFSLSSSGTITGVDGPYGSALPPYSTLSADYQLLLRSGNFTHAPPGSPPSMTLTISGLSVGQLYQFQWWVHDARDTGDLDRTTVATAVNSVSLEHNVGVAGGVGQFVLGTFTADASTQQISFQGFGAGAFVGSTQINAVQLRALPEPGSLALAALAIVAVSANRARTRSRR